MSYIILRGRWFHIIVLNVHAPTEDKTDDVKDSFYEESELVLDSVRFDVFTLGTTKNVVLWDVTEDGSSMGRRFGGTCRLHHQGDKNRLARNNVSSN
jgi:hypothetical protein